MYSPKSCVPTLKRTFLLKLLLWTGKSHSLFSWWSYFGCRFHTGTGAAKQENALGLNHQDMFSKGAFKMGIATSVLTLMHLLISRALQRGLECTGKYGPTLVLFSYVRLRAWSCTSDRSLQLVAVGAGARADCCVQPVRLRIFSKAKSTLKGVLKMNTSSIL